MTSRPAPRPTLKVVARWIATNDDLSLEQLISYQRTPDRLPARVLTYFVLGRMGKSSGQVARLMNRSRPAICMASRAYAKRHGLPSPAFSGHGAQRRVG